MDNQLESIELVISERRLQIRRRAGIEGSHRRSIEIVVRRFVSFERPSDASFLFEAIGDRRLRGFSWRRLGGDDRRRGILTGSFVMTAGGVSIAGVLLTGGGATGDLTGAVGAGCEGLAPLAWVLRLRRGGWIGPPTRRRRTSSRRRSWVGVTASACLTAELGGIGRCR